MEYKDYDEPPTQPPTNMEFELDFDVDLAVSQQSVTTDSAPLRPTSTLQRPHLRREKTAFTMFSTAIQEGSIDLPDFLIKKILVTEKYILFILDSDTYGMYLDEKTGEWTYACTPLHCSIHKNLLRNLSVDEMIALVDTLHKEVSERRIRIIPNPGHTMEYPTLLSVNIKYVGMNVVLRKLFAENPFHVTMPAPIEVIKNFPHINESVTRANDTTDSDFSVAFEEIIANFVADLKQRGPRSFSLAEIREGSNNRDRPQNSVVGPSRKRHREPRSFSLAEIRKRSSNRDRPQNPGEGLPRKKHRGSRSFSRADRRERSSNRDYHHPDRRHKRMRNRARNRRHMRRK